VHRVGERIDRGDHLHPAGKALLRIDRAAREVQHRVEHAEDRARHQRIGDAHHQQEHHADQRERGDDDHDEQPQQRIGSNGFGTPAMSEPIIMITIRRAPP
jgi:hypothetical protein